MEFLVWEFHRYRYTLHRKLGSARIISCGQREALCITKWTNTTTAIVVVSEAGAAKLEDLAEGRAQPSPRWAGVRLVAAPIFVLTAYAILAGFSRLCVADAWCLVGIRVMGLALESIEHGAGLAFIPVFFPMKRSPDQDG